VYLYIVCIYIIYYMHIVCIYIICVVRVVRIDEWVHLGQWRQWGRYSIYVCAGVCAATVNAKGRPAHGGCIQQEQTD
jgi:hypothetical protein